MDVRAAVRLTREDGVIVAILEGADIASQGDSVRGALEHLRVAVAGHLEIVAENDGADGVFDYLRRIETAHDRLREFESQRSVFVRAWHGFERAARVVRGDRLDFTRVPIPVQPLANARTA